MEPLPLDDLATAGHRAFPLVLPGSDWVHRRVQQVSYLEPRLMVNRLSVDFTAPGDGTSLYLPVSVLPKWPPLYRFDFRRADGTPIPLLTSKQNGIADEALMLALVEDVSPTSLRQPGFREALTSLSRGPETHLEEAFETFRAGLQGDLGDPKIERVLDIAAMLTDATLLWYPVREKESGARTLCKVEYLIRSIETHRWHVRLLRSLSWHQPAEYIPLWHIGADANFHAEVEAPAVLTIRSVEPRYYLFADDGGDDEEPDVATEEAEDAGLRPDEHIDREGRLAHIYVAGRRPLAADLLVTFSPSRAGAVVPAFAAAVLIAMLTTFFYLWRGQLGAPANVDASVAVLILVPALIGYVVIRPSDPPLARRYIFGTQLLSLAAGVVPLGMALLLLRYDADRASLQSAWLWSIVASWIIVALLFVSVLKAGEGDDDA
jgi:hypothetical protein